MQSKRLNFLLSFHFKNKFKNNFECLQREVFNNDKPIASVQQVQTELCQKKQLQFGSKNGML